MTAGHFAPELIAAKRDGRELDRDQLAHLVTGYLDERVSEGQMAAFLMAGVLNGFSRAEALALTEILVGSGEVVDLSALSGPTVDKHSTGGVGDGTTLLVAPLLAACGAQVVKLSGRGLGHTGGTLDKLEAIPGLRTDLDPDEMLRVTESVGCVVAAQSARLVPADKALYALRDVTATVASTALIASSVMSKKLASGAEAIVLDVKAGSGAFMADPDAARELAELCVTIGTDAGRATAALVTAMDAPLGSGIGNALEVAECVQALAGQPAEGGRLGAVARELAATGLALARGDDAVDGARDEVDAAWASGAALERLAAMVEAQGGDPKVCEDPWGVMATAPVVVTATAARAGVVASLEARAVGVASAQLGAGRAKPGDDVDPAVGIDLAVTVGDAMAVGDPLGVIHARDDDAAQEAVAALRRIAVIGDDPVDPPATILERITPTG